MANIVHGKSFLVASPRIGIRPFIIQYFINDIYFFVENSEIHNYADDNTLSVADTNIDTIISKLELDKNILDTWFRNNGLLLNEKNVNS